MQARTVVAQPYSLLLRLYIIHQIRNLLAAVKMSARSFKDRTLVKETKGNIFDVLGEIGGRNREQVVQTINQEEVSLGMVDPDTGRYPTGEPSKEIAKTFVKNSNTA